MATLPGNLATNFRESSSSGYCEGRLIASFLTCTEIIEWEANLAKVTALGLLSQRSAGMWLILSVRMAKLLPTQLRLVIT